MNAFLKVAVLPAFAAGLALAGPAWSQSTTSQSGAGGSSSGTMERNKTTGSATDSSSPSATAAKKAMAASSSAAAAAGMADSETVMEAQKALNASGANLEVDGINGPKTTAAIKEFQESHGLEATGVLDAKTMAALKR